MTHAYIADAVRTPRGKGNDKGRLKSVKPAVLLAQALRALARRTGLDTARVNDAIFGCVTQTADQGACVGTLANIFGQELSGSLPQYHVGTSEQILAASGGGAESVVLMLHIDFILEKHQIHGYVAFILDLTALHDLQAQVDRYLANAMGRA